MSMHPDVSVLIPNRDTNESLRACLQSLEVARAGIESEILVVDNGSTDGSPAIVRAEYPNVRLIANGENAGFAAAVNQAAEEASGRYLLLLNPDTVVYPDTLRSLVSFADDSPTVAAVGPRIIHPDNTRQRSCWRRYPGIGMAIIDALYLWKWAWLPFPRLFEYQEEEVADTVDVAHLLGACILIRTEAWKQVGPLDERFFLFLEETDWCLRARNAGWRIVHYPHVNVVHIGQQSVRQVPMSALPHYYRSYCHYYRKHHSPGWMKIAVLKGVFASSSTILVGVWRIRTWLASGEREKSETKAMSRGYAEVLRRLITF